MAFCVRFTKPIVIRVTGLKVVAIDTKLVYLDKKCRWLGRKVIGGLSTRQ
jgi:hypothetical protein